VSATTFLKWEQEKLESNNVAVISGANADPNGNTEIHLQKRVLNAGSGPVRLGALHEGFRSSNWTEVRLDIDDRAAPDIVGSVTDMRGHIADASFDAVWSSHSIEHLHAHEVIPACSEFRRVLKADGFALVTCPNLGVIAELVTRYGTEATIYNSAAGPIKALDMLYGHGRSIADGRYAMAHNTGFTVDSLGHVAIDAGFAEARVFDGANYDLWAAFLMSESNTEEISAFFAKTNISALFVDGKSHNFERATSLPGGRSTKPMTFAK
jgi:SAM-dependent methyltransferase